MDAYEELDISKLKTYSASKRKSKISLSQEAAPPRYGMTMGEFLKSLPSTLKANDLKTIARKIVRARRIKKPVIAMLGGHVIKTGCAPILADLASHGFITHFASNGSAAIHDTELATWGHTSEDVDKELMEGSFGMASDTASVMNMAAIKACRNKNGFGQTVGAMLCHDNLAYKNRALIVRAFELKIPYTLHIAIGTDIVHQHPDADGGAIGEASLRDFRIFAKAITGLGNGGVVLNFGSAVIMPEVLLKAFSIARNMGYDLSRFTTANFDMIQHYRPLLNVVNRPVQAGGNGYAITGHHEIMIPLLAAAIHEAAEV